MTPLQRMRIEKAAADCGFEMTPVEIPAGLELKSALFPESVFVRPVQDFVFEVAASNGLTLSNASEQAALLVRGFEELYGVLQTAAAHARTLPNRVADEFRRETDALPRTTEAERLVIQRVGQNIFRTSLMDYWQRRCCVTGLAMPELLRASHIKPWALCESDDERLDVFNGLLLAPHLDALFDVGLMTVEFDGTVRISSALGVDNTRLLGLTVPMAVDGLHDRHRRYLAFHHEKVWRDGLPNNNPAGEF